MKRIPLLLCLAALTVFAADNEVVTGPVLRSTGAKGTGRAGTEGQFVVSDLTPRYAEACRLGQCFTVATAVAGTTNVAANATPPAAGAATLLTVYNPVGSGKNLEVIKVYAAHLSGTPAAGGLWFATAYNTVITATQNATPIPLLASGGNSVAKGFTQTALTGGLVHTTLRPVANCAPFAGAIAATTVGLNCLDEVEGAIVLPPGSALSLASSGTGTTLIVNGAIIYREAPLP
jgi:hypothetical protein